MRPAITLTIMICSVYTLRWGKARFYCYKKPQGYFSLRLWPWLSYPSPPLPPVSEIIISLQILILPLFTRPAASQGRRNRGAERYWKPWQWSSEEGGGGYCRQSWHCYKPIAKDGTCIVYLPTCRPSYHVEMALHNIDPELWKSATNLPFLTPTCMLK